ncbi:L-rhamnose mutarotase [Cellulophaga sp. L1A9]|uniref:L-rhamnose mutarotase n=1 Tax=Cellulophaga sp. L1A9 TaxID=2686362 RepID=UPI00351A31B5
MESIKTSGIQHVAIYSVEDRLFMITDTSAEFSFESKNKADLANPKVQEWEKLMWNYQQALPNSKKGEKWRLMEQIFEL